MKRHWYSLAIAAVLLAGSGPSSAEAAARGPSGPTALGPEHRLSAQEIRDLAKREVLWCDDYQAGSDDCDAITLIQIAPNGRLAETTTLLISDGPRLQAYIGEVDDLTGDAVCNKVVASKIPFAFTLEGKEVPADAAAGLRDILAASLSDLDGKTVCQTFYQGSDPSRIREEVTVDGRRRPELETTYVLHEAGVGFGLRAHLGHEDNKGVTA
jgi:hypothetical protein